MKDNKQNERQKTETVKVCPRCSKEYTGYPALSRRDNTTNICSDCGLDEALSDYTFQQHDRSNK